MSISILAAFIVVQGASGMPRTVEYSARYDCTVRAAQRSSGPVTYGAGDYTFLIPIGTGLITGRSIPFLHTGEDGRTLFEEAIVEAPSADLGPTFGFALRTRVGAVFALTNAFSRPRGAASLRGSYPRARGLPEIPLQGECRVRRGPIPVTQPG